MIFILESADINRVVQPTCPVCSVSSLLIRYIRKNLQAKKELSIERLETLGKPQRERNSSACTVIMLFMDLQVPDFYL